MGMPFAQARLPGNGKRQISTGGWAFVVSDEPFVVR